MHVSQEITGDNKKGCFCPLLEKFFSEFFIELFCFCCKIKMFSDNLETVNQSNRMKVFFSDI